MEKMEIERRFLLYPCSMKRFLKRQGIEYEALALRQFYVVADSERVERYRKQGDAYIRTIKRGRGLVRDEFEERISKEAFDAAFRKNSGGVIRKTRRVFEYEGHRFELDSFKGPLKGLNILEIEFDSEAEAKRFEMPAIFRRILAAEVTDNPDFSNGAISRSMRIPAIETDLQKLLERVEMRESFLKASTPIGLTPFESGAHALKALFHSLLKSVEANRAAILSGDEEPERLHQLRVAMRKLRALLSQMSPLFEKEWLEEHKAKLAGLMRQTGEKRDIDVYLMHIPLYKSMVPKKYHAGIDALETYLRRQVESKTEALKRFLRDAPFTDEMAELERFAREEGPAGLNERAEGPIIIEVKQALRKRYRKVLKKGGEIDAESEAHLYHMVRIDVKKLRYMMEFFSSILDEDAFAAMLKKLKTIQTILGEHQDLDVQRHHLKAFTELPELHTDETIAAIKALRHTMAELEMQKRKAFREAFYEFSRTGDLFHKMVCKF